MLRDEFERAIGESLYDDSVRLIYADWLDDNGDPDRAEFIRVQCELEPIRDQYELERAAELHRRENQLLREHRDEWLAQMPEGWLGWEKAIDVEFRRGCVDIVSMPARTFLELGEELRRNIPTVRRLVLFLVQDYGKRLAECPSLAGLPELELACWYSDADAKAIAGSAHLKDLQVLEIWIDRQPNFHDIRLCRIMAGSSAWPKLRELTFLDPMGQKSRSKERLVRAANKEAKRDIAKYQQGYPELYSFAADFEYAYPGYLPDGRMALGLENGTTTPPSLCVLTFDENGRQTKDILDVTMPEDLWEVEPRKWYQFDDRFRQHLVDTIGFRPGFIRIQQCTFPHDDSGYYRIGVDNIFDELGYVDIDTTEPDDIYPRGNGGRVSQVIRHGEFIFGWDRYIDKRGVCFFT